MNTTLSAEVSIVALKPAAIELNALTKRYSGGGTAVDSINLNVASGSYCCLLGPSGCGKSTTLRTMTGHESVTSGTILLEGREIMHLPAAARGPDARADHAAEGASA